MSIELVNVHKAFGPKQVLDGFTLTIHDGETTSVIGGSGSGKSVADSLEVDRDLGDSPRQSLAGSQDERCAGPAPVVDVEADGRVGLRRRCG